MHLALHLCFIVFDQDVVFPTEQEQPESEVRICYDCLDLRWGWPLIPTTAVPG